ncbi:MAG: divergent PAP2 family protein [Spirochaetaceae bacterium]|nr:divergent PAP2 family protein [Spirochaetaceae bacterium]MBQ4554773.1 divergent PAP2 family protein [Spirochaetaceae bacterium]
MMPSQARLQLITFFSNPVLLSIIFSWFGAQFIKTILSLFAGKVKTIKDLFSLLLWRTGGMPSSHSALVTSLCTSIGFRQGVDSDIFLLSLAFMLVVIRDAVGVRRSSGNQAKVLNKLGKQLQDKDSIEFTPVKEVQGHKPLEVVMGCLLGLFTGIAFSTL